NAGNELTDILPAQLHLVAASASSGTAVANVGTNTVTWNGTIAASGSVTITITATIDPAVATGTTISNQGTISYDSDGDGDNDATRVTDDASQAGSSDPTGFAVAAAIANVPALDGLGLFALAAILSILGLLFVRRA
ncbi:MAG: DUF11 domain-containing protein, partial [Acidobacteria bacterium]|nr:DUF11 domain-containing protein [Acidobacteriota bacterium]